jgi:hypothetical protein
MSHHAQRDERGNAMVVWCLLLAVILLPLGGLSIDLWHAIAVQRQLQAAAEDAAAAGASGIDVATYRATGCVLLDPSLAMPLAEANLALQRGLAPLAGVSVQLLPGDTEIAVVLTTDVRLTLLSWAEGDKPLVVTASASSAPRGSLTKEGCP